MAREAVATFPGENGGIAFQTNRITATNPEGDFEIYTMRTDGTGVTNLTNDPAGDFTPDWQPRR